MLRLLDFVIPFPIDDEFMILVVSLIIYDEVRQPCPLFPESASQCTFPPTFGTFLVIKKKKKKRKGGPLVASSHANLPTPAPVRRKPDDHPAVRRKCKTTTFINVLATSFARYRTDPGYITKHAIRGMQIACLVCRTD